ncbi:MAG: hypothetical protein RLZZ596_2061, partial [Pseudomonadota bacterium]
MVEQLIRNEKVGGSIPLSGTNEIWYNLKTLFTVCTDHIVNNLGPNG